ncbi:hypothetical protein BSKO_02054 [Bryopsis sp. KO-2023]|nr:hypothetical protein BSKO_02054 [Bryopsis sp. KO-2023]
MAFQPLTTQFGSASVHSGRGIAPGPRMGLKLIPRVSQASVFGHRRLPLHYRKFGRRSSVLGVHACASTNGSSSVQAVCLGEGLFDMLADQFDVPRDKVTSWTPHAGGAPCNVSAALAKLGISVAFASAVGKDDMGDDLLRILKASGVDLSDVQRTAEPTRDVYVTRTSGGEREFSGFGLPANQYGDCFLDVDALPIERIQGADVLITGTLGLAYPATGKAMRRAVKKALAGNTLVMVDVNWRPVFFADPGEETKKDIAEFVKLADIVKLTDEECEWLFGLDASTIIQSPCEVRKHLPNAKGVLVTGGEKGAGFCFDNDGTDVTGYIPVFDIDVIDTTGAGDAFTAGFVYQLLNAGGVDNLLKEAGALERAVRFASACGGLTTTKAGAIEGQPTLESVVELAATQVA